MASVLASLCIVSALPCVGFQVLFLSQVGAIVLYTYVFHMLAPPPGGYDAGDEDVALKSPTRGSPRALTSDDSPERLPLLAEEATPTYSSSNKKQKVRTYLIHIALSS